MKIKKILAFACALCLFGGTYSAVPDFSGGMSAFAAEEQTYDVLEYVNHGDYIEITNCDREASGDLIIPESIDGVPVETIGKWAFSWRDSFTSITIPDSVRKINDFAFFDCASLMSINVSEANKNYCSIDGVLFDKNAETLIQYPSGKSNDEYSVPDSVTSIGMDAFHACTSLVSVNIPDSVTSIGKEAFYACTSLASVNIPDSVTSIEGSAFLSCTSLASITIPNSVTSIGIQAFCDCTSLVSIDVAEANENYCSIDGVLFDRNATTLIQYPAGKNNDEYSIPDSVTSIEFYAFYKCTSLVSVNIPDSVTYIGFQAFGFCKSLASLTIPDSVKSIEAYTFSHCTSLESITIPDSVTCIGRHAFDGCTSLESINIPDNVTSIEEFTFMGCTSLESITIPDGVTIIGQYAFEDCISLLSATIPDSVKVIDIYAFYNCTNLASITIKNPECDMIIDTYKPFDNLPIPKSATIYSYKDSTVQTYASRNGNKFISITDDVKYGDVDGSGDVTIADAVAIVSYIANSEMYPLGSYDAADVYNRGDGINASDAISVQNFLLGNITSLPESFIE